MKNEIILIGSGGHALSCIDIIEQNDDYKIIGLLDKKEHLHTKHLGYYVIGDDKKLEDLQLSCKSAFICIGHIESPKLRMEIFKKLLRLGYKLPAFISDTAYVSKHAQVGDGTIVMNGATVGAGVIIGKNCIINSHSLIEHNSTVKDHCHISTGAIINGDSHIGEGTFIGSGALVLQGIKIGKGCIIGMGVSVRSSLKDNIRFTGKNYE